MKGKRLQPYKRSEGVLYVRVPPDLMAQLDAYMEARQKEMPRRVKYTRSDVVRTLLSIALEKPK